MSDRPRDPARRDLIRRLSAGGAVFMGGTMLGHVTTAHAEAASTDEGGFDGLGYSAVHDDGSALLYGHTHEPPAGVGPGDLDHATFPPAPRSGDRRIELDVVERHMEVGAGVSFHAWTFGGSVPGPIIRATEGDRLEVRLRNLTGRPHNLHFHGAHTPEMDGWEPIPPGGEFTYEVVAGPPGLHPYHCHLPPLAEHVARGLYGMFIVDPVGGRSPAHEVALLLSGFSTDQGQNAVTAWNGVAGYYARYPIKVAAGDPVRAYVLNMMEYEPVGSLHLHAQTFDVYPAGMGTTAAFSTDTITMGQSERAILEFTLPAAGRYMFHPHQHHLADRGAMGWFAAV